MVTRKRPLGPPYGDLGVIFRALRAQKMVQAAGPPKADENRTLFAVRRTTSLPLRVIFRALRAQQMVEAAGIATTLFVSPLQIGNYAPGKDLRRSCSTRYGTLSARLAQIHVTVNVTCRTHSNGGGHAPEFSIFLAVSAAPCHFSVTIG